MAIMLLLILLIVALLNIPAVQTFVTQKITKIISDDYGVDVEVGGVMLAIPNTVQLRDVFVPGQDGDTLLFLGALKADVQLFRLIHNQVDVKYFSLSDLKADVRRGPPGEGFNFDFLIDAFVADNDTTVVADTTPSDPWQISINHVNLENIDASYRDETGGMDAKLNLGSLDIYVDEIDFSNPEFLMDRIILEDTKIAYEAWNVDGGEVEDAEIAGSSPVEANSQISSELPALGLNELALKNVQFDYLQHDSELKMHCSAGDVLIEPGRNDLNRQHIAFDNIFIGQTVAKITIASDTTHAATPDTSTPEAEDFSAFYPVLPGWQIAVADVNLDAVTLGFDDVSTPAVEQGMDFSHLLFGDVTMHIRDVVLNDELAEATIAAMSLNERSGLAIDSLRLNARLTPESASVTGFAFNLDDFQMRADFNVGFNSLDKAFQNPELLQTDVNLRVNNLSPATFEVITGPVLAGSSFSNLRNEKINFALQTQGTADSLEISRLKISAFGQTAVSASGHLMNLSRVEDLFFDLALDTLITSRSDALALSGGMIPGNIMLPDSVYGNLSAKGSLDKAVANLDLNSNFGNISSGIFYAASTPEAADSVEVQLTLNRLNLGKILDNEQLGEVNLVLTSNGSGLEKGPVDASLTATVFNSAFNNYVYEELRLEAQMQDSLVWLKMLSDDPNARFSIDLETKMDSTIRDLAMALHVDYLDLHPLNFIDEKFVVETSMQLSGNYNSLNDLNGDLRIEKTRLTRSDAVIPIREIHIMPNFGPQGTYMDVTSELVNFNFDSNVPFSEFSQVIQSAIRQYLGQEPEFEINPETLISFSAGIDMSEDFRSHFLPDLNELQLDTIIGHYSGHNNSMALSFHAPLVNYSNFVLKDLHLDIAGMGDTISLESGFRKLFYDSLYVSNFKVSEQLRSGDVQSAISITGDDGLVRYQFLNRLHFSDDSLRFYFEDDGLTLNGKPWSVNPGNELMIVDTTIISKAFSFSEGDQKIAFNSNKQAGTFTAEKFQLQNLLSIFKSPLHEGVVKGRLDLDFDMPYTNSYEGIGLALSINELYVFDSLIGDITVNMEERVDELQLDVRLNSKVNRLHGSGTIGKEGEVQPVDFKADFRISSPARFESLTQGYLSGLDGIISGDLSLQGNISRPEINGSISFNQAQMTVDPLNLQLNLPDETMTFTRSGIGFDDFEIFDNYENKLTIDGNLFTDNLENPAFDMHIKSSNFQPVNSTKMDNSIFYGSLVMDADVFLKGDLDLPVINADLAIKKGTDLTYVLPGSEIEIISSDGIVNFTSPAYEDDSLRQITGDEYLTDSILPNFEGIDLNARLDLNPEAKFTVIIDPYSGDYSSVQGSATMNYTMDASGSQSLTGVFEVSDGIYQLSFYGLVKKTFEFVPGSSIAWSGRPMDANINFTAKNIVRTQSVALVANESSGMTEAELNMFKQRLPYEVLLNLDGFIDEPEVSFNIELPEKYQINYPQIASKLTMLNSGQNESELNKQVFALLVSGSFIADNPFSSSGGSSENFATTAARNSVNGILAQQLNNISSRYIKGIDMNFGLTTYEDYSGSSTDIRTELDVQVSKKLLDERLTVEASGSFDMEGNRSYTATNSSHTYGEFSATYDLTQSREYKLRAYRENAYDLFEGEVAYSGIAFIIEKSFDKLFKRTKKDAFAEEQKNEQSRSVSENPEGEND